ncbi:MAG: GIY-YIG nuclease family protein [Ignavibacteriaceae bacterium]
MYFTYVLKCLTKNRHYYGSCEDLDKRLAVHNKGKVRSTKGYIPWQVCYFEQFPTRSQAYLRKQFFKTKIGRDWLKENFIL